MPKNSKTPEEPAATGKASGYFLVLVEPSDYVETPDGVLRQRPFYHTADHELAETLCGVFSRDQQNCRKHGDNCEFRVVPAERFGPQVERFVPKLTA